MTSKQTNSGQGMTRVRTRSGPVKIKSGPVKMLQGIGYIKFTENSCQGRVDGEVW